MTTVSAKVATILSDTSLALNVGTNHGVKKDAMVSIIHFVDIEDPDSHEKLGTVAMSVLKLRVTTVQEKLCTAIVSSIQDDQGVSSVTRVRRLKRIADSAFDEKAGISVHVAVGDHAIVGTDDDEPPF